MFFTAAVNTATGRRGYNCSHPALPRCIGLALSVCLIANATHAADEKITYEDHIKPIIRESCESCHNPDKLKGDLDMTVTRHYWWEEVPEL